MTTAIVDTESGMAEIARTIRSSYPALEYDAPKILRIIRPHIIVAMIAGVRSSAVIRSALKTSFPSSVRARTPSANTAVATDGLTMKKIEPIIQVT
jgi:hypothetical protein